MEKKEIFVEGEHVRLSKEALRCRNPGMEQWEGTVDGVEYFPLEIDGRIVENNSWVKVHWDAHREDGISYRWTERPENLVKA